MIDIIVCSSHIYYISLAVPAIMVILDTTKHAQNKRGRIRQLALDKSCHPISIAGQDYFAYHFLTSERVAENLRNILEDNKDFSPGWSKSGW